MRVDCMRIRRSSAGMEAGTKSTSRLSFVMLICGQRIWPSGAGFDQREHILDVQHAQRIVERLAIDRQARMLRFAEERDQLGERGLLLDRDDVRAGHHDVGDRDLAEAEQVGQHQPLLRAQVLGFAVALLDHLFEAFVDCGLPAETFDRAREARRQITQQRTRGRRGGRAASAISVSVRAAEPEAGTDFGSESAGMMSVYRFCGSRIGTGRIGVGQAKPR